MKCFAKSPSKAWLCKWENHFSCFLPAGIEGNVELGWFWELRHLAKMWWEERGNWNLAILPWSQPFGVRKQCRESLRMQGIMFWVEALDDPSLEMRFWGFNVRNRGNFTYYLCFVYFLTFGLSFAFEYCVRCVGGELLCTNVIYVKFVN